MFAVAYFILASLLYLASAPFLLLASLRQKHKRSIIKRFFPFANKPFEANNIWFHVCSFGEARSIRPLIDKIRQEINISVVTQTGFSQATKYTKNVRYLPFEIFLPFWIKRAKILIVLEAELWLMLFFCARRKKIPTILLNARISDRSWRSYKRFAFFYRQIFKNIDHIYAQSEKDAQRLRALGAKNIEVAGNIKLVANIAVKNAYEKPARFLCLAASTHRGEEELIINAWLKNRDGILAVVPRHPERFAEVADLMQKKAQEHSLIFERFSHTGKMSGDLVLVDLMGALNELYAICDVAILGGAFEKIGGHNFVEPAFFGKPIITGEHFFNQQAIFPFIENIRVVKNSAELEAALQNKRTIPGARILQTPDLDALAQKILSRV